MRMLAILLVAAAMLSICAIAQQSDSAVNTASQNASERQPIPAPTSNNFWDGDDPNFLNLITHPFANKKYVQRHTEPIRDRLNELDQITSENSRMMKDVDSRAQQGLQMASEKVNLADQHASDSSNRAQLAQTAANQASTRVSNVERAVENLSEYKGTAETEIQFRPGQTVLSKTAKDALDQMADPLKGQHNYIIEIRGFSAGHGQTATAASRKMADSVVRYFVLTHQIPVYRIYVMSMGNAAVAGQKHVRGGRVEISVLKNEPVSTAQR